METQATLLRKELLTLGVSPRRLGGGEEMWSRPGAGSSQTCLVAQSCLTLCNSMDCSPPGSPVHGFSRQEYWGGLPSSPPGGCSDPGIELRSPVSPALSGGFITAE